MRLTLLFTLVLLLVSITTMSQSIEITIVDFETKEPIPYATVFSNNTLEGAVSNEEGTVVISNFVDTLTISHLGFIDKLEKFSVDDEGAIVLLEQETIHLAQVSIYSLDLKEKLRSLQENTSDYYETNSINYYATYKETLKTNDSLSRLFQVQLEWYKKNGAIHDFSKPFHKQNQVKIGSVDYSKINEATMENSGHLNNATFSQLHSVNFYLTYIVELVKNVSIHSIERTDNFVRVTFGGDVIENDVVASEMGSSIIYFDTSMSYIHKIHFALTYLDNSKSGVNKKTKTAYTTSIKNVDFIVEFNKYSDNGRLSLSLFKVKLVGDASFNDSSYDLEINQELLVNALRKGKRLSNKIDLKQPIYESVQEKNANAQDVLFSLTKEESDFINN